MGMRSWDNALAFPRHKSLAHLPTITHVSAWAQRQESRPLSAVLYLSLTIRTRCLSGGMPIARLAAFTRSGLLVARPDISPAFRVRPGYIPPRRRESVNPTMVA